jgi:HAD superfamily hydrolase (TIGR01509 family)
MWTDLKSRFGLSQPLETLVGLQGRGNIDFLRENHFEPIDGIPELVRNLAKNALAVGLASSSPSEAIALVLNKFALDQFFSVVVSGEDLKHSKPAPDIFLKTAKLLNVLPSECLVVEDAMHGVAAAKAAGMKCVGFVNKNSWNQDLSRADFIVDTIKEINVDRIRALFL